MVAPPACNELEFKVSGRADGGWVRNRVARRKGRSSLRKTVRLDDQVGETDAGAILKTLQFCKLVSAVLR